MAIGLAKFLFYKRVKLNVLNRHWKKLSHEQTDNSLCVTSPTFDLNNLPAHVDKWDIASSR